MQKTIMKSLQDLYLVNIKMSLEKLDGILWLLSENCFHLKLTESRKIIRYSLEKLGSNGDMYNDGYYRGL